MNLMNLMRVGVTIGLDDFNFDAVGVNLVVKI